MKKNANPKHRNQVRITGGSLRGRKITFAQAEGLRPTPDSVRERLFNWLGQDLTGQDVLDLFAGSGALGFEALSRNARRAWLCDNAHQTVRHLTATAQEFGIAEKTQIAQQDSITFLNNIPQTFHTVFLDPPFMAGLGHPVRRPPPKAQSRSIRLCGSKYTAQPARLACRPP